MKKILALTAAMLLVGCTTLYNSVVTITEVRKSTLTELGTFYRLGLISPETDAKIEKADQQFLKAASVLELSLTAYKSGQDVTNKAELIKAVKAPVFELINILATYSVEAATKNNKNLEKANQL